MWQSRKGLSKMKSTIKVKLLQVGYTFIYLLIKTCVRLEDLKLLDDPFSFLKSTKEPKELLLL